MVRPSPSAGPDRPPQDRGVDIAGMPNLCSHISLEPPHRSNGRHAVCASAVDLYVLGWLRVCITRKSADLSISRVHALTAATLQWSIYSFRYNLLVTQRNALTARCIPVVGDSDEMGEAKKDGLR